MFTYPPVPQDVESQLRSCESAIIIGHVSPDGDCIHSQISMSHLMGALGKPNWMVNTGPFERSEIASYDVVFEKHINPQWLTQHPIVIIVDCSSPDRIGYLQEEIVGLTTIVIDHHASGTPFGNYSYIVPQSLSTTLVIYTMYEHFGIPINPVTAEHLFFGLATDTGFFRFIGPHRGETFHMAANLIEQGVSPNQVFYEMNGGKSWQSIKYLARLIDRTEQHCEGKLCVCHELAEDADEFGLKNRPSDTLYSVLLSVGNVEAVLFFKNGLQSGTIEVGLRASHASTIDVGAIAAEFGGGGHKKAAGAVISGNFEDIKQKFVASITAYFNSCCN